MLAVAVVAVAVTVTVAVTGSIGALISAAALFHLQVGGHEVES